ncbi:MAG: DnaA/Hda family protein [Desulfuromonadaceae bacterium]|nr:DnaA/Hda family protein [Desulfuromonadaceae bacterium]MDD2846927.1 DnaA/Hda family protein [Desulfuromonadaceae bacterium]MDD4129095.1 DnaA/Hda family protein [Desulfuromonadaceae bacterium]
MQQFFEFPVSPSFSFDSFVPCEGNVAALRFALRITDPADSECLLYLYGPSGSGKTHLLKAIAGSSFPYLSLHDQISPEQLVSTFSTAAGLVVDDLQAMPDDPDLRRALWQLFNEFHTSGRTIAMAGAVPPRELSTMDDHLTSRLLWGLVARLDTSDDTSRRMIIKKVADDHQIRIPDEVVDYILATTSREVGALITCFHQLYRFSMAEKRRITLPLAREVRELTLAGGVL